VELRISFALEIEESEMVSISSLFKADAANVKMTHCFNFKITSYLKFYVCSFNLLNCRQVGLLNLTSRLWFRVRGAYSIINFRFRIWASKFSVQIHPSSYSCWLTLRQRDFMPRLRATSCLNCSKINKSWKVKQRERGPKLIKALIIFYERTHMHGRNTGVARAGCYSFQVGLNNFGPVELEIRRGRNFSSLWQFLEVCSSPPP